MFSQNALYTFSSTCQQTNSFKSVCVQTPSLLWSLPWLSTHVSGKISKKGKKLWTLDASTAEECRIMKGQLSYLGSETTLRQSLPFMVPLLSAWPPPCCSLVPSSLWIFLGSVTSLSINPWALLFVLLVLVSFIFYLWLLKTWCFSSKDLVSSDGIAWCLSGWCLCKAGVCVSMHL